jgi:type I restriction enzyme, S subunit
MKWEKVEIGSVCDVGRGSSPRPIDNPAYFSEGTIPWVKIADATASGKYIYQTKEVVNDFGASFSRRLQPGALIIATSGVSLGQIKFLGVEGCIHDGWLYVNNFKGVDKEFLYYHLLTMQEEFLGRAYGAAIQNINTTILRESKINFPPLPTQRKIASILSAYDDLIENNLKRIKLLEEKAFLRYKQIVREEKELKKIPLAQFATVTSSKRIFLSDYVEEGIPFYRSKEIITKSNFESIGKPLYITEERYSDIKEKFGVPVSGDLLITSVGTIGFVHLVNDDDGNFYFKDGNLIWIKNLLLQNLAYFLFFKFRTHEFKEMLNSVAIGSSQKALTIETVKKIEIEIPSEGSLIEFNQETKTIIKFIYNLQKQNTKLREARDILLPRLMSGEIEV